MSFNTEEVYLEKNQDIQKEDTLDKIEITIKKNTSDENLNEFKYRFKNEFNLDFTWENLKRNTQGLITSIDIRLEEEKKGHLTSNAYDDNGIKPFIVYFNKMNGEMGTSREKDETIGDSESVLHYI